MINRAALILRYREPAVKWVNDADPYDASPEITIDDINHDRTVYLISDEDAESGESVNEWVELNYLTLFEVELEGWYTDPSLWPEDRSLEAFHSWFHVECNTVIIDTVEGEIHDDDI